MIALNLTNLRDKLSMQFICWVFYAKLDEKLVTFNCKYCKKYTKKLTTKYPKKWYIFIKRLVGVQCMGYKLHLYICKV